MLSNTALLVFPIAKCLREGDLWVWERIESSSTPDELGYGAGVHDSYFAIIGTREEWRLTNAPLQRMRGVRQEQ